MLAYSFHVVRVAILTLALLFSFTSAKLLRRDPASGTVHVRDEPHVKYRVPSAKPLAESATSQTTTPMAATGPTFQITEQELKTLLGIKLEFDLNLDVVHSHVDAAAVGRAQSSVVRIPVHIKIHELTIGGILVPSLAVEDVNLQSDPVNYGNIRVI
ncbi:hypothetical protein BG006_009423 [Podila minutissima]|uniref:Uncharacterized protein n=1 Tax=Podila minutissima TaxID=64525 RepID=A0A9P5SEE5_9FUNG|nr:hypothetical protein BG006_009423 [Podila minutissima]